MNQPVSSGYWRMATRKYPICTSTLDKRIDRRLRVLEGLQDDADMTEGSDPETFMSMIRSQM